MRIVQTFWTAGRNPLEYSFGWLRPEYNLMSWVLSCQCLRMYYDEVALYTDEHGKHILIDILHLPYTEVHVVYDETLCPPQHWSYAKIKTYSLQTKPFLHIDADIFLSGPIAEEARQTPLIAQSKERGTKYYRHIIDRLLGESSLRLPKYLEDALKEESVASYNMGLFGGNDLDFIHAFCREAMALCDANKAECSDGNFNLLFEQMLFACLTERKDMPVSTVCPGIYNDNGYTAGEFCQLYNYRHKSYFHLLGGHKRNQEVIETFVETFMTLYPGYYKQILSLYPHYYRGGITRGIVSLLMMTADLPIRSYIDFLSEAEREWGKLTWEELFEVEQRRIEGKILSLERNGFNAEAVICRNPYLKCFDVPASWGKEAIQTMRKRLSCKEDAPIEKVAVIPTLLAKMRKEYAFYELEWQVLEQLKGSSIKVSELLNKLIAKSKSEEMCTLWLAEIQILLNEGLLIPYNNFINH